MTYVTVSQWTACPVWCLVEVVHREQKFPCVHHFAPCLLLALGYTCIHFLIFVKCYGKWSVQTSIAIYIYIQMSAMLGLSQIVELIRTPMVSRVRVLPPICSTHCCNSHSWHKHWITPEEYHTPSVVFWYGSIEPSTGGVGSLQLTGGRKVSLLHNNQLRNNLLWAGSVVVRYKHIATYFCVQTVLEKSLCMGMSMVKALILKVFRA